MLRFRCDDCKNDFDAELDSTGYDQSHRLIAWIGSRLKWGVR